MILGLLGLPSATSIAESIFMTAFKASLGLFGDAVKLLLDALFGFLAETTEPVFTSGWWTGAGHGLWLEVLAVAGGIMVVALMVAALEGMWSGTTAPMVKALGAIPAAVLKTTALVGVVSLLVSGTDQVANSFDGRIVSQLGAIPALIAAAISTSGVVGMLFAGVIVFAVLGLWAELAVRAATIYLAVMTAPMVIAASVHPRLRESWRKIAEIIAGLIFSKIVVALAIAVGFAELQGLATSSSFPAAIGALVATVVTLLLSCFAPFVLFRLFSLEVAHLEGLAHRPGRAVRDVQGLASSNRQGGVAGFLNRHGSAPGGQPNGGGAPGAVGLAGSAARGGPAGAAATGGGVVIAAGTARAVAEGARRAVGETAESARAAGVRADAPAPGAKRAAAPSGRSDRRASGAAEARNEDGGASASASPASVKPASPVASQAASSVVTEDRAAACTATSASTDVASGPVESGAHRDGTPVGARPVAAASAGSPAGTAARPQTPSPDGDRGPQSAREAVSTAAPAAATGGRGRLFDPTESPTLPLPSPPPANTDDATRPSTTAPLRRRLTDAPGDA